MMKLVLIVIVALYASLDKDNMAETACCGSSGGWCGDCSESTPCCGYGPCNIFCCNCDGGCRSGGCFKKQLLQVDEDRMSFVEYNVHSVVRIADQDGDKLISLAEAGEYFSRSRSANDTRNIDPEFRSLDTNADGFLSFEEIDPSWNTVATPSV